MKQLLAAAPILSLLLSFIGCNAAPMPHTDVAATTWPVYCFTAAVCEGTPLKIDRVITESVSCLHNYTLSINQMMILDSASVVVCSGAGLEDFMDDAIIGSKQRIDASSGISLLVSNAHVDQNLPAHEIDVHIWLSPANAAVMVQNICDGLCEIYPDHSARFRSNTQRYLEQLHALQSYGEQSLGDLCTRELITLHDGFAYFADAFDLTILAAIEEESGAEASAEELRRIAELVKSRNIPAVFTEINGSEAAASIIAAETGCAVCSLSMIMDGTDYLQAMHQNIDTVREALQ